MSCRRAPRFLFTTGQMNYADESLFRIARFLQGIPWGAVIAALLLAACSPQPAQEFTLRIGFFPTQDYLPYFVMQEQGFDKRNGLRLEETAYPGGAAIIEAMATGSIDLGYIAYVPLIAAAERGFVPGKAVSVAANNFADPQHPGTAVLGAASVGSWKDLRGKQVAVPVINSISGAAIKARLRLEGVKEYALVEIPFANMGLAVAGGNVAAAVMSEPFLTQSLVRGDGKLLGWVVGGPPFEQTEFTSIVFRAALLRDNPQAVKRFLRAQLEAVNWINRNLGAARLTLARRLDLHEEIGQKIHLLHWPSEARSDPASSESIQRVLMEIGMLKAPIPASRLYDETLLNEVLAEKR